MTRLPLRLVAIIVVGLLGAVEPDLRAQTTAADIRAAYTKAEHMVPMRDGVKLFTIVYTPKDTSVRCPFMLHPNAVQHRRPTGPTRLSARRSDRRAAFAATKYIFVYQDVRGKFRSEGTFLVMRPLQAALKGPREDVDESTRHLRHDRVAAQEHRPTTTDASGSGGSRTPDGRRSWGMIAAHPALKASSPQASAIDMFLGDDFHHNGAFRSCTRSTGCPAMRAPRGRRHRNRRPRGFDYGTPDGYASFSTPGPWPNINEMYFHDQVPTWNEYMDHPNYDTYWQEQNPSSSTSKNITHAVLNVAGWFDAEDFYGPLEIYRRGGEEQPAQRRTASSSDHGCTAAGRHAAAMRSATCGSARPPATTSDARCELPFFKHYLKDEGPTADARGRRVRDAAATSGGRSTAGRRSKPRREAVHPRQRQARHSRRPPRRHGDPASTSTSPIRRIPSRGAPRRVRRRATCGWSRTSGSRRARPDVLVYQTEPLTEDVTIAGPILAKIVASRRRARTADWIVKLIDVYPGNAPRQPRRNPARRCAWATSRCCWPARCSAASTGRA